MRCSALRAVAAGMTLPLLAGCWVAEAGPDRITVQHNVHHPWTAETIATRHCEKAGKVAVWAGSAAPGPRLGTLFTEGTESTYDCVDPAAAPAKRFPDPPPEPAFD